VRCALYVRVRTNEQAKSGYSIPTNCRTFGATLQKRRAGATLRPGPSVAPGYEALPV
jgi:hypothetical protein